MTGFVLVWAKTLDSSLWVKESKETRLVFLTLLMMKNSEGQISASVVGLADRAKVTVDECKASLKILLAPDPDDTSKVEEGKRIREIPGGWEIVNHDLYRFSTEAKRAFWAQQKAEQRKLAAEREAKRKAFEAGYESEHAKRRKPVAKAAKLDGEKAGAQAAINEGLNEANSESHTAPVQRVNGGEETVAERLTRLGQEDLARRGVVIQPKSDFERPNCDDGK